MKNGPGEFDGGSEYLNQRIHLLLDAYLSPPPPHLVFLFFYICDYEHCRYIGSFAHGIIPFSFKQLPQLCVGVPAHTLAKSRRPILSFLLV